MPTDVLDRALSVRQLARRWGVAPRKVRALIRRGIVAAIDLGIGRQQLRVTPEAVRAAEERLAVQTPRPRCRKRNDDIDPDVARMLDL